MSGLTASTVTELASRKEVTPYKFLRLSEVFWTGPGRPDVHTAVAEFLEDGTNKVVIETADGDVYHKVSCCPVGDLKPFDDLMECSRTFDEAMESAAEVEKIIKDLKGVKPEKALFVSLSYHQRRVVGQLSSIPSTWAVSLDDEDELVAKSLLALGLVDRLADDYGDHTGGVLWKVNDRGRYYWKQFRERLAENN